MAFCLHPLQFHSTEGDLGVEEIIRKHRSRTLCEEGIFRVTVRRNNIWEDAVRAIKLNFNDRQYFRVTFLGESAVDGGGP